MRIAAVKRISDNLSDAEVREIAGKLSPEQLQIVVQEYQGQNSRSLLENIRKDLKSNFQDIIRGLVELGYYEQEFELLPGFKCSFRSLLDEQWKEAWEYYGGLSDNISQMVALNQLNRRLTSHALHSLNGQIFAGVSLPGNYAELVVSGTKTEDIIKEVVDKKHRALGAMPLVLVDKIVNYHRAFSTVVDELINNSSEREERDTELKSS